MHRHTAWVVLGAGVLGLVAGPLGRSADACSWEPPAPLALPATGNVLPSNVAELVVFWPTGEALRLVDVAAGTEIPLGAPVTDRGHPGMVKVPLGDTLVPGRAYALGDARLATLSTFTAGAEPDLVAPPAPTVSGLALAGASYAEALDTCSGQLSAITGTLAWPAPVDEDLLVVRITDSAGTTLQRMVPATPDALRLIGSAARSISTPVAPGETYQVTLATRDLAGNESAQVPATLRARDCGVIESREDEAVAQDCVFAGGPSVDGDGCATTSPPGSLLVVLSLLGLGALGRSRRVISRRLTIRR